VVSATLTIRDARDLPPALVQAKVA
jgi:hypothetical protein